MFHPAFKYFANTKTTIEVTIADVYGLEPEVNLVTIPDFGDYYPIEFRCPKMGEKYLDTDAQTIITAGKDFKLTPYLIMRAVQDNRTEMLDEAKNNYEVNKKIKELNIPKDDGMALIYEEMLNNRKDSEK